MMTDPFDDDRDATCLEELSWYHRGVTRNVAEALLLNNSEEGTYLLRDSGNNPGHYTVSTRCESSVKHFILSHNKEEESYDFGVYNFYSFAELFEHFRQRPVLGNDAGGGIPVSLLFPYPNDVYEPRGYMDVTRHGEIGPHSPKNRSKEDLPDFHMGSKEGFLTKRGDFFKSWKRRWFTVQKEELKYFENKKTNKPKKVWDLNYLIEVSEAGIEGKQYCFRLIFPNRVMYCIASSAVETKEWIDFLQWKIDHFRKMKNKTI